MFHRRTRAEPLCCIQLSLCTIGMATHHIHRVLSLAATQQEPTGLALHELHHWSPVKGNYAVSTMMSLPAQVEI
jgi:hypothetical protein